MSTPENLNYFYMSSSTITKHTNGEQNVETRKQIKVNGLEDYYLKKSVINNDNEEIIEKEEGNKKLSDLEPIVPFWRQSYKNYLSCFINNQLELGEKEKPIEKSTDEKEIGSNNSSG